MIPHVLQGGGVNIANVEQSGSGNQSDIDQNGLLNEAGDIGNATVRGVLQSGDNNRLDDQAARRHA